MAHKYRAKPQDTEWGRFDSKKELARWNELLLLQRCGEISGLTRDRKQCTFDLHGVDGSVVCRYVGDFCYVEAGRQVVDDAKGMKTQVYRIKRKLFLAEYKDWEHRES
jgi:hypothetical protein